MTIHATLGTMKSGKTSALIKKRAEFEHLDTCVVLPHVSRVRGLGEMGTLQSRDGSSTSITHYVDAQDNVLEMFAGATQCVFFVDEIQFYTRQQIVQWHTLSQTTQVYAYGLEADFRGKEFEAIRELKAHKPILERLYAKCDVCFVEPAHRDCMIKNVDNGINAIYKSMCRRCMDG